MNDHGVFTLPAYAILDNMLNVPERDYRTFEEMCSFFPKDEPSTVRNALTELKDIIAHLGYKKLYRERVFRFLL